MKVTHTINLPVKVAEIIPEIKEYLQNRGFASFSNGTVSISDAISWAIKTVGGFLGLDLENGDLNFIKLDLTENPNQAIWLEKWKSKNLKHIKDWNLSYYVSIHEQMK